ncbi:hypothetical protein HZB97_00015 [Candidatus Gottesmanbacteria bacterium]|nr:hypothetical protein [Candidatus Gottesmanbacteria bacterium]
MRDKAGIKKTILVIFLTVLLAVLAVLVIEKSSRDYLSLRKRQVDKIVDFDEQKRQLIFFDKERKMATLIDSEKLDLDKSLPIGEEAKRWDLVHIGAVAVQDDKTFFFPVSRSFYCGANNCSWHLYSYKLGDPKPQLAIENIFGNVNKILLSPDKSKIAVLSYVHGGYCNNGIYLYLLEKRAGRATKIDSLNLPSYSTIQLESVYWQDNNTLEFKVLNFNCEVGNREKDKSTKRTVVCSIAPLGEVECKEI